MKIDRKIEILICFAAFCGLMLFGFVVYGIIVALGRVAHYFK